MSDNKPTDDNKDKLLEILDKCIIIKINGVSPSVYNRVRRCWGNSKNNAEHADYVLAVLNGRIVGIFVPYEWFYTCDDEECQKNECKHWPCKRIGFNGEEASIELQKKYLNKYIPDSFMEPGPGAFRYTFKI